MKDAIGIITAIGSALAGAGALLAFWMTKTKIDRDWLNHLGRIYSEIELDPTISLETALGQRRDLTVKDLEKIRKNFVVDPYDVTTINKRIEEIKKKLKYINNRESEKD